MCLYFHLNCGGSSYPPTGDWGGGGGPAGGSTAGGSTTGGTVCYDCDTGWGPPSQLPTGWPNGGDYGPIGPLTLGQLLGIAGLDCDPFGACVPAANPWTVQVGGSVNLNFWNFSFNFAGGFAIDSHGHVATYQTTGRGVTGGGAGSVGTQVSYSNADTVCGLGGPFWNASGTFGAGGAVSADVFQGKGNGPGGTVTGGGVTAGAGGGAGGSVTRTETDVAPITGVPCH